MRKKEGRLQIRVDQGEKELIERAAERAHLSVSAFVLSVVAPHAEQLLAEDNTIRLSGSTATAFAEALQRPAVANARLADALRRPRKFTWVD